MRINKTKFSWKGTIGPRSRTEYIILHHRAGNGDVKSIHKQHLNQGYSGIGYNFYIRKDGSVYAGRPMECAGAHTVNYNFSSVGVCFEGDFHNHDTAMSREQMDAGAELIRYLMGRYPNAEIKKHGDMSSTACPGKNFPFWDIVAEASNQAWDIKTIARRLNTYGIVTDQIGLITEVSGDPDGRLYWFARKALDYITTKLPYDAKRSVKDYEKPNDIIWELKHRGIVSDDVGFIKELLAHPNGRLYWLARKIVTFARNRD